MRLVFSMRETVKCNDVYIQIDTNVSKNTKHEFYMPRRQFILYILMLASFFYQETKLIDICTLSTIGAKQPGGTPSFGGGFGSGGGLGANQSGSTPSFGSAGSLGGLGSTNTGASGLGGGLGGGGSTTFGGWVLSHMLGFSGVKVFSSMS